MVRQKGGHFRELDERKGVKGGAATGERRPVPLAPPGSGGQAAGRPPERGAACRLRPAPRHRGRSVPLCLSGVSGRGGGDPCGRPIRTRERPGGGAGAGSRQAEVAVEDRRPPPCERPSFSRRAGRRPALTGSRPFGPSPQRAVTQRLTAAMVREIGVVDRLAGRGYQRACCLVLGWI